MTDIERIKDWCERIKNARAKATPGRWTFNSYNAVIADSQRDGYVCAVPATAGDTATKQGHADASYIELCERQMSAAIEAICRYDDIFTDVCICDPDHNLALDFARQEVARILDGDPA